MKRLAYQQLQKWMNKANRKPLIVKGARQTGKTFLIREFAQTEFANHHVFNFQKDKKLHSLFSETLDAKKITQLLSDYGEKKIDLKKDLIFFDEIQECPMALNSLKYFSEDVSNCFVVAAGSLLGLYLNEESFPVGKVEFIELYPMHFYEYLLASNHESLTKYLDVPKNQIPTIIHEKLVEELRTYLLVGGLPEVLNIYLSSHDLNTVRSKQNELLTTYKADFAKHSGPVNALNIVDVFESIPKQFAKDNKKFSMKLLGTGARYSKFKTAIEWLLGAGLCYKVPIVDFIETPLKAYTQENSFKLYFFDVGLLGALSELPTNVFLIQDQIFKTFKGVFVENLFLQEFKANRVESVYCWQGKTAEIEFVIQNNEGVFPIEVKSGTSGKLKSLNVFFERYPSKIKTRASFQNYIEDPATNFRNLPLYLSSKV